MEHDSWVRVASFASGMEAELAIARLRQGGVYAVSRGHLTGVFGYASMGASPWGVDVLVPGDLMEEAAGLLEAR